ncbi:XRE family transcriptional regulator [Streptomyces sp. AC536]|uniref:XRE family transcriptional regulator n=1 Tax=Streptomyces buecherae TaxID=2763006 RepID=UPI00164DE335|nr:XRE family transcriptional regulator [Streptomyces buecherae]MBC3981349.1 XRE family transcriptional regulator [Streptomyces buecherae]QNJ41628.1 XRE family transcriptional regulator [Streptomyces buecherae]
MASEPTTALPRKLLDREDLKAACAAHDFGALFRIARTVGISYSKIAAECEIKPERVGTLARGQGAVTSFEKIARIADALRIPGHLVGLAPREWEAGGDMRRREFIRATTGVAVHLPEQQPLNVGSYLGRDIPEHLRYRTARLRRLDEVLGGGDTFRLYSGEVQATKRLLRETSYAESTGCELLSVLAEQAQQAGWAGFDAGMHEDARSLYEESRRAAVDAGDAALAANALAFLGYQELSVDNIDAGLAATTQASTLVPQHAPGAVRALLYERHAWACAVADQTVETERALEAARTALMDKSDTAAPDWAAWVDDDELDIMTGRCWTVLGRPLRSVPLLEEALSRYDDRHTRDKALYSSWLAESYLKAGEVEQAARVAKSVLELSMGVASVRPRQRITPTLRCLTQHAGLPAVAEVLELARAA